MKHILVTGAAGFIGYHLCRRLMDEGYSITGMDNLNPYYEVSLKQARLELLKGAAVYVGGVDAGGAGEAARGAASESGGLPGAAGTQSGGSPAGAAGAQAGRSPNFTFIHADLADRAALAHVFEQGPFDTVVHLAAQAGVRYSLEEPLAYIDSNITGLVNLLEFCRSSRPDHLVFASSSSVYGSNARMPYSVQHNADHPLSLYGATKKSGEMIAHAYAHLYALPVTCLRFFTVYGPWGRPDMAYCSFTRDILAGKPISVYNYGHMKRDFTYIDDIIEGVYRVMQAPPAPDPSWDRSDPDPSTSHAPYKVYNIGRGEPVALLDFIGLLEQALGKKAEKKLVPGQPGDVAATWADVSRLKRDTGFAPGVGLEEGIGRFTSWYLGYYTAETRPE
jgi:UDP-glucuronate 4-epimerase